MSEARIKEAFERGFEFEKTYHGCAQCVVGALYEVFPELRNEDVFRAASALGAGVGLYTICRRPIRMAESPDNTK